MPEQTTFGSWWPFTFAGAARFGYRPWRTLLLLQLLVAVVSAGAVMLYFQRIWWPLIPEAIGHLPAGAQFERGQFRDPMQTFPMALAQNSRAAIITDLNLTGGAGQVSDVQVEFGSTSWRIRSLLGYVEFRYAPGQLNLDASTLNPAWEAWKPAFLVFIGAIAGALVFASWMFLAFLGMPIAKLMGFFADHALSAAQAWKLCGAALMPGALFFSAAILLYTISQLNLLGLGLAALIHLIVGGIYMIVAPWRLPCIIPEQPVSSERPPHESIPWIRGRMNGV